MLPFGVIRRKVVRKKVGWVVAVIIAFAVVSVTAQDRMLDIMDTELLTVGDAAYLTALCMERITDADSNEAAVAALQDVKGVTDWDISAVITLKQFAHLALTATGASKNLWYRVGHAPYYAFRDLKAQGIVAPKTLPSAAVSGKEALRIFSALLPNVEDPAIEESAANEAAGEELPEQVSANEAAHTEAAGNEDTLPGADNEPPAQEGGANDEN